MSQNKTERVQHKRFNHWFWNSFLISFIEQIAVKVATFLWQKQYNRK